MLPASWYILYATGHLGITTHTNYYYNCNVTYYKAHAREWHVLLLLNKTAHRDRSLCWIVAMDSSYQSSKVCRLEIVIPWLSQEELRYRSSISTCCNTHGYRSACSMRCTVIDWVLGMNTWNEKQLQDHGKKSMPKDQIEYLFLRLAYFMQQRSATQQQRTHAEWCDARYCNYSSTSHTIIYLRSARSSVQQVESHRDKPIFRIDINSYQTYRTAQHYHRREVRYVGYSESCSTWSVRLHEPLESNNAY